MKLETFIKTVNAIGANKTVCVPFQLHDGMRRCIEAFGGPKPFGEFLLRVLQAEEPDIKNSDEEGKI